MNPDFPPPRPPTDAPEIAPTLTSAANKHQPIVAIVPKGATADETSAVYQAFYAAHQAACAEEIIDFKVSLFEVFTRSGIMQVEVNFDGSGDAGQIEGIYVLNDANEAVDLPAEAMTYSERVFETVFGSHLAAPDQTSIAYHSIVKPATRPLTEAIEDVCYDLLHTTHHGWEDNEGAFGLFRFDTKNRAVTLEYNERYTETNYSEHEW